MSLCVCVCESDRVCYCESLSSVCMGVCGHALSSAVVSQVPGWINVLLDTLIGGKHTTYCLKHHLTGWEQSISATHTHTICTLHIDPTRSDNVVVNRSSFSAKLREICVLIAGANYNRYEWRLSIQRILDLFSWRTALGLGATH